MVISKGHRKLVPEMTGDDHFQELQKTVPEMMDDDNFLVAGTKVRTACHDICSNRKDLIICNYYCNFTSVQT
jgi:hypothetical protein